MTTEAAYAAPGRPTFDWQLLAGLVIVALVVLPALASLFWTPHANTVAATLAEPSAIHWLGTDAAGRDVLSSLMSAALASLLLVGFATLVCLLIGVPVGAFIALRYEGEVPPVPTLSLPASPRQCNLWSRPCARCGSWISLPRLGWPDSARSQPPSATSCPGSCRSSSPSFSSCSRRRCSSR